MYTISQEKWCNGCDSIKPVADFCKNRTSKTGLSSWCRECNKKYRRTQQPLRPRKLLSKDRSRANCRKQMNKWAAKNRDRINEYRLKRIYGINTEEYERKFTEQGGKCFICKKTSKNRLSVDHNHETGEVRSLLCSRCNFEVGIHEKDVTKNAEKYLRLWDLARAYRKVI